MRTRRRTNTRKRVIWVIIVFFLLLVGVVVIQGSRYLPALWGLVSEKEITLAETPEKKVNVLLLGVGGGSHDGPDLTDTIIFASIDPEEKKVTLASIPRDLWIPDLNAKINSAYTYAEDKEEGIGLAVTKSLVGRIIGERIDYAVKIDFAGFEKAVDMAGGLDIDVANTFDDYAYPINGLEADPCGLKDDEIASLAAEIASGSATESEAFPCRYEHLHFDEGLTKMDGETALKYVRSRHSLGEEGSDFARSKRQEKIITAFRDKIFSVDTFLNPVKFINLLTILEDSIKTDIKEEEYDDFVRLAKKMEGAKITSAIVDTGDTEDDRYGLLVNPLIGPEYGNQWVLIPRVGSNDYSEIQEYIACVQNQNNCTVGEDGIVTPTPTPKPTIIPTE